jgi:hypothetical protein
MADSDRIEKPSDVLAHPDFQLPWIQKLLTNPDNKWRLQVPRQFLNDSVTNSLFEKTLRQPDCIRAHITFIRPTTHPTAIRGIEECWLLSIGSGVDGKAGRGHGGFNALVLDQISGSVTHHARPVRTPPATATMTVDYKAPVSTPCVILLRAWIEEVEGRKCWVRGVIEDGEGRALTTSRALFVFAREDKI